MPICHMPYGHARQIPDADIDEIREFLEPGGSHKPTESNCQTVKLSNCQSGFMHMNGPFPVDVHLEAGCCWNAAGAREIGELVIDF